MLLTGDCSRLMEDSSYLRIHRDHVVALECDPLVTAIDLCIHPVLEVLPHDSVNDIRQVGSAELLYLFARRQGSLNISIILGKVEDVLDGKTLELRNIYDFDVVAVDDGLDSHGEISQVPYGDGFIAWQVCSDLRREETVHL